jgi:diacylglycerol kinase (ATP)
MMMAPSADTGDGVFDVVHVGALSRRSLLATFPKLFKGTHVSHPTCARCRALARIRARR